MRKLFPAAVPGATFGDIHVPKSWGMGRKQELLASADFEGENAVVGGKSAGSEGENAVAGGESAVARGKSAVAEGRRSAAEA